MYSYGPPHMAVQKQDDQLELTYSNYVRTQDVTLKTCRRRWMIGRSGKRESEISVLAACHDDDDDDDDDDIYIYIYVRIIQQMRLILFKEFIRGTIVYSCTFFKEINRNGSFYVPEDCQHDLLYWLLQLEHFYY